MQINDLFAKAKQSTRDSIARARYRRRTRVYCVGTAKSGTHSIASMFDDTVRTQHEPDSRAVIRKILEISDGRLTASELKSYLRARDKRLCLDIDSSQLNYFLLDGLLEEFPDARFVLTLRDCYAWLNSFINDSLRRAVSPEWLQLREYRFRANGLAHPPEERALQERGLYTLDGYLAYWATHNQRVLSTIPPEKLYILKTQEIHTREQELAKFSGLAPETVRTAQAHSFRNSQKFHVLSQIDPRYLESKVQQHCAALMQKFFPTVHSLGDAIYPTLNRNVESLPYSRTQPLVRP